MTEVTRLPGQSQAQLDGSAWVTDLERLAAALPYDLAVTAAGCRRLSSRRSPPPS